MKYYFYVLLLIAASCSSSGDSDGDDSVVSRDTVKARIAADTTKPVKTIMPYDKTDLEDSEKVTVQEFYNKEILPLYSSYTKSEFPQTFTVDSSDLTINAGAAFGHLEISLGLVECTDDTIQMFAIAHELGHIVTLEQAERLNLGQEVPRGKTFNSYQKGELIADLMSVYSMSVRSRDYIGAIQRREPFFHELFADGDFAHPNSKIRLGNMFKYYELLKTMEPKAAMEKLFTEIWTME